MKQLFLLIALLTSFSVVSAIYQWTDEDGVTHFSDDESKPSKAQEIKVKLTPPSIESLTKNLPEETEPAAQTEVKILPAPIEIAISSPSDQQTLRSNTGEIKVSASLSSSLKYGFKIRLLIDGVTYSEQINSLFQVKELPLGDHKLQMQVVNNSGRILASSEEITIYLHRFQAR